MQLSLRSHHKRAGSEDGWADSREENNWLERGLFEAGKGFWRRSVVCLSYFCIFPKWRLADVWPLVWRASVTLLFCKLHEVLCCLFLLPISDMCRSGDYDGTRGINRGLIAYHACSLRLRSAWITNGDTWLACFCHYRAWCDTLKLASEAWKILSCIFLREGPWGKHQESITFISYILGSSA